VLRLNRVTAASHLSERIVWRISEVEFGFYDSRRWTEHPAHFVEQLLSRELFETHGLRRARAGRVPTMDVKLLAFEEVLEPEHHARIELRILLLNGRSLSLLERTYTATEAVQDHDPISFTRAMGRALDEIVSQVAGEVEAVLPSDQSYAY
jgi:ABC-type uncharacterized transport system auxiliary subunit